MDFDFWRHPFLGVATVPKIVPNFKIPTGCNFTRSGCHMQSGSNILDALQVQKTAGHFVTFALAGWGTLVTECEKTINLQIGT